MSKHISNPAVASAWQDKHLLQYFKSQQLANRCLSRGFILTAKCCWEEGKPGQRSEARAATQTQTKKCYSWTLVFLQHPPVSFVAVGNLTSTLKLCVCYYGPLLVEQPSEKCLVFGILEKPIRHILSYGLDSVKTVIFRSLFLSLFSFHQCFLLTV